jgi:hypothetical protein
LPICKRTTDTKEALAGLVVSVIKVSKLDLLDVSNNSTIAVTLDPPPVHELAVSLFFLCILQKHHVQVDGLALALHVDNPTVLNKKRETSLP